jgi:hypothetical protein
MKLGNLEKPFHSPGRVINCAELTLPADKVEVGCLLTDNFLLATRVSFNYIRSRKNDSD